MHSCGEPTTNGRNGCDHCTKAQVFVIVEACGGAAAAASPPERNGCPAHSRVFDKDRVFSAVLRGLMISRRRGESIYVPIQSLQDMLRQALSIQAVRK